MASAAATIPSNKAHPTHIAESDTIIVSGLTKMAAGAASLYEDNLTTSIVIGGGTGLTTGDTITVDAGAGDLRLSARSMATTITLNQSSDTVLNSAYVSASITSLIGAVNALQDGRVSVGGTLTVELITLEEDGQALITLSNNVSASGIKILFVNGIAYFDGEGFFVVGGANNEEWTWQNEELGEHLILKTTDRIVALYIAE